jgi:predicted metal-dependent peptidase
MFATNITPKQRLDKAVVAIMNHERYRALAGVLMIGNREITSDKVPTACTDGKNEWYHPDFVEQQTDAQLRFLILHEVYHKLYKHLTTWQWMYKQNPTLANVACDYVINVKLHDENKDDKFAVMPEGGCFDEKYRNWDSAQVFHDLLKQYPPQPQGGSGQGKPDGGSGQPGDGPPQGFDEHLWDEAQDMTAEQREELAREIDAAIRQGALMAGKTGSGGDRSFDELLEPQVDWREVLRDFVTETCAGKDYSTWRRPNRRFVGMGHYMPSSVSEQIDEVVIAPDMSGSTFSVLPELMSEVKGILEQVNPKKVHIIYWDTQVCSHETYDAHEVDNVMAMTKPEGGGGTTVECVPEYMAEHGINPQAAIILTDGYLGGSWGNWTCPTLWAIIDNKSTTAGVGQTVHINSNDM